MRYVAAYLLAALGGKENPSASDIKKILDSVGIEADDTRMGKVSSGGNDPAVLNENNSSAIHFNKSIASF